MKLRTKTILFFGSFLFVAVSLVALFGQYVVGAAFKKQTTDDLRIFAEQAEGSYYTLLKNMKVRSVSWSSDPLLQQIVAGVVQSKDGTQERARFAKEFADYIKNKKMPYDKTVFLADLIDKEGIVVASTGLNRIGTDEGEEEDLHKVSHFSKTITADFGQAFVKSIVFEEDETTEPMVHATTRVFTQNSSGAFVPLDAVLMLHFLSIEEIADVLSGESQLQEGAKTGNALLASYDTSEIYLVNSERLMVTPTRFVKDVTVKQYVDTFPVRECLENGKEVLTEYDDYRGVRVFGATMCLESEGLVLVVEINKDEIFAPLVVLMRTAVVGGIILLVVGVLAIAFFVRLPLSRIDEVVQLLERVMNGDFTATAVVRAKDETGRLALMFNTMVDAIRKSQKDLQESKRQVEEKALILEKDIEDHQKQEKFLAESKKATLNLLEDAWNTKEQLEDEGSRLQAILGSIGDALILVDTDYRITLANNQALKIFKTSREELVGKDLRDVAKLYRKKVLVEPGLWPTEEVFLTKKPIVTTIEDGFSMETTTEEGQLPIAFSIAPMTGRYSGVVIVVRDITAESELDEAKNGFISVASHQLRTPLTSIRWYSEMLLSEDAGPLNEPQKDFMKEIHGGAQRLYQTVDLLLGISRVESGKIKADKTAIDLKVFTEEIGKELRSQIDEKELAFAILPPEGDSTVWLDSLTLRQVVLNLISNAIRYTNAKGIIEVKWNTSEDGSKIVYSVHDDGIGIPKEQQSRIFSKFFRAENARAQVPDGSGLGLALVKDLVVSWGGEVWFETGEGNGTTFYFTVPLTTRVDSSNTNTTSQ